MIVFPLLLTGCNFWEYRFKINNEYWLEHSKHCDSITMKLFETIIDDEQVHLNYFDNVNDHINDLGASYLAQIAGTSASTGPTSKGFVMSGEN